MTVAGDENASRLNLWLAALTALGLLGGGVLVSCLVFADPENGQDTPGVIAGPPGDDGGGPPPGAERRSIVVTELAGGHERVLEEQVRVGGARTIAEMQSAGIRNAQIGQYAKAGGGEAILGFHGGELSQPLAEDAVATAAPDLLDAAFKRFAAIGPYSYDGTTRPFEAGPLGGEVRCTTMQGRNRAQPACGWVDRWTIGYVFDSRRGSSEADAAEALLALRADLEVVTK